MFGAPEERDEEEEGCRVGCIDDWCESVQGKETFSDSLLARCSRIISCDGCLNCLCMCVFRAMATHIAAESSEGSDGWESDEHIEGEYEDYEDYEDSDEDDDSPPQLVVHQEQHEEEEDDDEEDSDECIPEPVAIQQ